MKQVTLQQELIEITRKVLNQAEKLNQLTDGELNQRPSENSWSALECIRHLNQYHAFYNPEIGSRIEASKAKVNGEFKSSWLGNYFANSMKLKENMKKMKTLKKTNPIGSKLKRSELERFINYQHEILGLLHEAEKVNWTKTKTGISISKMIKLRLGDTFKVVIYHNERHLVQAMKAVKG